MSELERDGGPAFPLVRTEEGGRNDCLHTGMSLRDYFAAAALQGMLVEGDLPNQVYVKAAYETADLMLTQRNK